MQNNVGRSRLILMNGGPMRESRGGGCDSGFNRDVAHGHVGKHLFFHTRQEHESSTLLLLHVVVLCSPNFRCGLTPISDPGCPQLKNYYSPIWIAMRWYKARAFMRHHKTPGAASAPAPIKHKGLIPFSSKLVIQHLPSFFCTLVPRMPV